MNNIHLQGDIGLHPCEPIKGEVVKHKGEFILALGELSGHGHILRVLDPSQMVIIKDKAGNIYAQILGEATMSHELIGTGKRAEHGVHTISPGWYKLGNEREYNYFELESQK